MSLSYASCLYSAQHIIRGQKKKILIVIVVIKVMVIIVRSHRLLSHCSKISLIFFYRQIAKEAPFGSSLSECDVPLGALHRDVCLCQSFKNPVPNFTLHLIFPEVSWYLSLLKTTALKSFRILFPQQSYQHYITLILLVETKLKLENKAALFKKEKIEILTAHQEETLMSCGKSCVTANEYQWM